MQRISVILGLSLIVVGCTKKEETPAPAPAAAPTKVSIESTDAAPPPPPVAGAAQPTEAAPPPEEKRDPDAPPKSVYDNISPEQKIAAKKSRRNMDWIIIFKDGSDAQKQQAKKAIDALPPAEKAEFEGMIKLYGVKYP